jgi:hypothetical protein
MSGFPELTNRRLALVASNIKRKKKRKLTNKGGYNEKNK